MRLIESGKEGPMPEITGYYNQGREQNRLTASIGQLEYFRTQELIRRFLPAPPAIVFDIGGGAGNYAFWLASVGYPVHLIDAMPLHIEQAQQAASLPDCPALASMAVGDARRLGFADESADAVLLLGPLYHLTERADRILALREAYRTLRKGGIVCAVGISRFASALDGLFGGLIRDPEFVNIMKQDLATGQHRNPNNRPGYFTTACFHYPEELESEVREAGFESEGLFAIEGPGGMLPHFADFWDNPIDRETLLDTIRMLEREPSLLGASSHILAVGRKTEG